MEPVTHNPGKCSPQAIVAVQSLTARDMNLESPWSWQPGVRPQTSSSFLCRHPPSRHFVLFPGPCPDHTHPFAQDWFLCFLDFTPACPGEATVLHRSPWSSCSTHFLQKTEICFYCTKFLRGLLMLYFVGLPFSGRL